MERKYILLGAIGVLVVAFLFLNREDNTFYYDGVREEINSKSNVLKGSSTQVPTNIIVVNENDKNIIRVFSNFRRNVCGTKEKMTAEQINNVLNDKIFLTLVVKLSNNRRLQMREEKLTDFISCLSLITSINNKEVDIKDVKNVDIKPFVEKQKGKDIEKDSSFPEEQKAVLRANNTEYLCKILNANPPV